MRNYSLDDLKQQRIKKSLVDRPDLRSCKVMVVADELSVADTVNSYLHEDGFRFVVTVPDSAEAERRMSVDRPDVILLNVDTSDEITAGLPKFVRKRSQSSDTPVIVISSDASEGTRQDLLSLGANDVLSKPVQPSDLILLVDQALSQKVTIDRSRKARLTPATEQYQKLREIVGRS